MPVGRVIPASQIGALRTPPVRWCAPSIAPVCRPPLPSYPEFLHKANLATPTVRDVTYSPNPAPLGIVLREHNTVDRRAETRAQADAPLAFAALAVPQAPCYPRPLEHTTHELPCTPALNDRPIVPPIPTTPVPLLAAYRLNLPLARGSVVDILA